MKELNKLNENINNYFDSVEVHINEDFISEEVANKYFFELDIEVKSFLEQVFGKEDKIKDFGKFPKFLKYNKEYTDGIIFSYWSFRGDSYYYSTEEKSGDWRDNFFYKGIRWSEGYLKQQFYDFYEFFKNVPFSTNPVNFFVTNSIKDKTFYLRVTSYDITDNTTIKLPTIQELYDLNVPSLDILLEYIENLRKLNREGTSPFERKNHKYNTDDFKKLYIKALGDTIKKEKKYFSNIYEDIQKVIRIKKEYESNILERIFSLIIIYQYYDTPYDIYIFLPKSVNGILNISSSLIFTTEEYDETILKYEQPLKTLIETLNRFALIEKIIWEKLRKNLPKFWVLKEKYHKYRENYELLTEVILAIVKTICIKEKITFTYKPHRIKEFKSFYEKIVKIANDKSNDQHDRFRKFIEKGDGSEFPDIFDRLNDIVGARIVCLYNEDITKIDKKLDELNESGDIIIVNPKNHDKDTPGVPKPGYTSLHRTIQIGGKRMELFEYKDIIRLKCELQIRTLLSDAWANVEHQISYKPKIRYNPDKIAEIDRKMLAISYVLSQQDQQFNELKEDIEKIILEKFYEGYR
ncbi:MAG: hypothetical protein K8R44_06420 [Sulfurimonas sp.]|nr:hypothetical protein [Sulfurimonas sp.]